MLYSLSIEISAAQPGGGSLEYTVAWIRRVKHGAREGGREAEDIPGQPPGISSVSRLVAV
jgi:hypothetical protein